MRVVTYPAGDVRLDLDGEGVCEQEQAVHPQSQTEEGHNLGGAGVEGDPDQGGQSHPCTHEDNVLVYRIFFKVNQ